MTVAARSACVAAACEPAGTRMIVAVSPLFSTETFFTASGRPAISDSVATSGAVSAAGACVAAGASVAGASGCGPTTIPRPRMKTRPMPSQPRKPLRRVFFLQNRAARGVIRLAMAMMTARSSPRTAIFCHIV